MLVDVGYAGRTLDDWLRDGFFEQHCNLFHQRPFIWHVWDGLRDGFAALVNYHRLDTKTLDQQWISMHFRAHADRDRKELLDWRKRGVAR